MVHEALFKHIPVVASYNELVYGPSVLGMDYMDCSNQTLARVDFKIKGRVGHIVSLHKNHKSFPFVFAKVADE